MQVIVIRFTMFIRLLSGFMLMLMFFAAMIMVMFICFFFSLVGMFLTAVIMVVFLNPGILFGLLFMLMIMVFAAKDQIY